MVYENNTTLIFMLCNLIEKKQMKCSKYWANSGNLKNFTLSVDKEEELDSNLIERSFTLVHKKTSETRIIKQIHFTGWPDHGVPEINDVYDSFIRMIGEVDLSYANNPFPIVVHCSAGVGRTGTFMSIYNIHYLIQKQIALKTETKNFKINFNIWNTVRKLKEQRILSVENILQYKFIYSFFSKYICNLFS